MDKHRKLTPGDGVTDIMSDQKDHFTFFIKHFFTNT